jgi:type IV secretory pathway TrbF-like protein
MESSLAKIIVIIVTVAIIVGGAYWLYVGTPEIAIKQNGSDQEISQKIIDLTEKLKTVSIDASIFSSAAYRNLHDFSPTPFPENMGRPNPFALIGMDSVSVQVSTTTTRLTR